MRIVVLVAATFFVGCGAAAAPVPRVAHEPVASPPVVVSPHEVDCAAKTGELEDGATPIVTADSDAATTALWLSTALPDEHVVALRLDTPGASLCWSDGDAAPLPTRVALDPNATSVRVQAVVRMADGRCQTADAEISVVAAPLLTGATIAVHRDAVVVEPSPPTYSVRLRDLERRVNELKERIYRSKPRLTLLESSMH